MWSKVRLSRPPSVECCTIRTQSSKIDGKGVSDNDEISVLNNKVVNHLKYKIMSHEEKKRYCRQYEKLGRVTSSI